MSDETPTSKNRCPHGISLTAVPPCHFCDHEQYVAWVTPQLKRLGREMAENERMRLALQKLRNYNCDIAAQKINYHPFDHIAVADEGLGFSPEGLAVETKLPQPIDLEYVAKILENNSERAADLVFDAKALAEQSKDPGLDGMILGIEAVAQQIITSLDALTGYARGTSDKCGAKKSTPEHVCGLQGFGRGGPEALNDECPACSAVKASAPSPVLDPTTWEVDPCSRGALYRHLPCGESYAMPPWGQQAAREDHAKDCKAENGSLPQP